MRNLKSKFRCVLAVAVTAIAALASLDGALGKQQKRYTPVQAACSPDIGTTTTVIARRSGRPVQVQSAACYSPNGKTTVVARPFGSEGDKYVCVGECRVVKMCLLEYCYNETVCDPCARTVVVKGD